MTTPNAKERKAAVAKGQALPESDGPGRYPVRNEADLKRAIRAVGRSTKSSHSVVRKFIMRRARALGLSQLIPDTWNSNGTLKG